MWDLTLRQFSALCAQHRESVRRADRRAGEILALLYNVNRDQQKDPKGATWTDFFPEWDESAAEQSDEQMLDAMMIWARATAPRES